MTNLKENKQRIKFNDFCEKVLDSNGTIIPELPKNE
jgi:hypothetical protein